MPLPEVTVEELRSAIDHLARQSVEAIVMIAARADALAVVHSADAGLPLIVVEGDLSGRGLSVGVDQIDGARQATQHLIDLGHRAIYHVSGPMGWTEAEGRLTGYEDAMRAAGLAPLAHWEGDWNPARGYELGRELAKRGDMTAVFVANDQMAIGVLHAFAEARLRVPDDVSVVGFDDIPEAGYLNPAADHRPAGLPGHRPEGHRPGHGHPGRFDDQRAVASPRTDHPRQHGTVRGDLA